VIGLDIEYPACPVKPFHESLQSQPGLAAVVADLAELVEAEGFDAAGFTAGAAQAGIMVQNESAIHSGAKVRFQVFETCVQCGVKRGLGILGILFIQASMTDPWV